MGHRLGIWLRLLWGLAHRRPKTSPWEARNGILLTGSGDDGIPYGNARVVLLYLAMQAAEHGRVVRGTLDGVIQQFGIERRKTSIGRQLRRLGTCGFATCEPAQCGEAPVLRVFDPFETKAYCPRTGAFEFTLSEECYHDILTGPRTSRAIVQGLIQDNQMNALDLYLWYRWRIHHGLTRTVRVMGPDSPCHLIRFTETTPTWPRKVGHLHAIILRHWADCPFSLHDNGRCIEYTPDPESVTDIHPAPLGVEAPEPGQWSPDPDGLASSPRPVESTEMSDTTMPLPSPEATAMPLPSPEAMRKIFLFLATSLEYTDLDAGIALEPRPCDHRVKVPGAPDREGPV